MNQANRCRGSCEPAAPTGRRGGGCRRPSVARAYGVKRSFTWLTDAGFAAAEERLRRLPNFLERFTPGQLAEIQAYDGPWLLGRGAPMREDLSGK